MTCVEKFGKKNQKGATKAYKGLDTLSINFLTYKYFENLKYY